MYKEYILTMDDLERRVDRSEADEPPVQRVTPGNTRRIGRRGLQIIEALAAEGQADHSIARALSLAASTFRRHRRVHPEVEEALQRGRARLADELTHLLLEQAREGNTVAAIFLAKARLGWRDQGPVEGATDKVNVTINLPGAMSEADYRRMLDITPPKEESDESGD